MAFVPDPLTTAAPIYPAALPCPLISGTAAQISAAVVRTPFQSGNVKQRRLNKRMPHLFSLTFVLKQDNAYAFWLNWVNLYGWNFFWIQLASSEAGAQTEGEEQIHHLVRFTSDLNIELVPGVRGFFWRVSVTAEWIPTAVYLGNKGPAAEPLDWIIAGSPMVPSADWHISGTASAPSSPDWDLAGTPTSPSSYV